MEDDASQFVLVVPDVVVELLIMDSVHFLAVVLLAL